jgi:hypothetical protein
MAIRLTDLLRRVSPDLEARVRRVRDQARPVVQEALRAECRLVIRTPEETEQNRGAGVPIEVAPGYPAVLRGVSFPDDFERSILLSRFRTQLEQVHDGLSGLSDLREKLLLLPEPDKWTSASQTDLQSVSKWTATLLKDLIANDPLQKVLEVEEDFLGVYQYDMDGDELTVNRASISLYWGVIGLVSEWLGCTVEDLTIVVLTHELAHAYTQLGADIEGRRWGSSSFAKAETGLKEGLAQYYTDRVLQRLVRRYGGAQKVFAELVPRQPKAYQEHKPWADKAAPEAVRRAMLEVRRRNEGKLAEFNQRFEAALEGLAPST